MRPPDLLRLPVHSPFPTHTHSAIRGAPTDYFAIPHGRPAEQHRPKMKAKIALASQPADGESAGTESQPSIFGQPAGPVDGKIGMPAAAEAAVNKLLLPAGAGAQPIGQPAMQATVMQAAVAQAAGSQAAMPAAVTQAAVMQAAVTQAAGSQAAMPAAVMQAAVTPAGSQAAIAAAATQNVVLHKGRTATTELDDFEVETANEPQAAAAAAASDAATAAISDSLMADIALCGLSEQELMHELELSVWSASNSTASQAGAGEQQQEHGPATATAAQPTLAQEPVVDKAEPGCDQVLHGAEPVAAIAAATVPGEPAATMQWGNRDRSTAQPQPQQPH